MCSTMPMKNCNRFHLPTLEPPNILANGMTYSPQPSFKGKQKLLHLPWFRALPPVEIDIPSPMYNIGIDIEDKGLPSILQSQ